MTYYFTNNSNDRIKACNPLNQARGQQNWIKGSVKKFAEQARKDGCSKKQAKISLEKSFEQGWEEAGEEERISPQNKNCLAEILEALNRIDDRLDEEDSYHLSILINGISQEFEDFFETTYIDPEDLDRSKNVEKDTRQEEEDQDV